MFCGEYGNKHFYRENVDPTVWSATLHLNVIKRQGGGRLKVEF